MASSFPGSSISPMFSDFQIIDTTYKNVNGTPIPASVLVPKATESGKRPVIVRWHGGGLFTGQRLFADWFPQFIIDYALQHNAIIISPDYRLMPEANGLEILDDANDLYAWLFSKDNTLNGILPEGVNADLGNVLVTGESAGGWLALQSAFTQGKSKLRAVVAHYPMIDLKSEYFTTQDSSRKLLGIPVFDPALLKNHVASLKGGEVVTDRAMPAGVDFFTISIREGTYNDYFGRGKTLFPLEVLDDESTVSSMPPVWILHGEADTVVPVEGTNKFASKLRDAAGSSEFHLSIRPGEEHGFENHNKDGEATKLDDAWMKEGTSFVDRFWG